MKVKNNFKKHFFPHDYFARNDEKIIKASISRDKFQVYGVYWMLAELLNEVGGSIQNCSLQYLEIALGITEHEKEIVYALIKNDLFTAKENTDGTFDLICRRAQRNCEAQAELSRKRSEAAKKRHSKQQVEKEKKTPQKSFMQEKRATLTDSWIEVFDMWIEYRRKIKKAYKTAKGLNTFWNELLKLSNNNPGTAKKIVEQSINREWVGIFELKANKKDNSNQGIVI